MRELQKYSHHVTLFTQMCQRLVSIYARDATEGVQQLAGELSGRYAGLTSSAAARAKTLQVKCKVVDVIFTLFEEGLCLLSIYSISRNIWHTFIFRLRWRI